MGRQTKNRRRDRPPVVRSAATSWWRRFWVRARPTGDRGEQTTTLCRQLAECMTKNRRTLAQAFCALDCAKVLLVEPGDIDALYPWHLYVGPRRPALLHLGGSVYSTRASLEEDAASHLVVSGETNRDERFRVILSMDIRDATMTAKIYRAPHDRPFGAPLSCSVRAHSVAR
ncbi:hypothetical protein psal_cds_935 [Pandoravirus salinus]|uniref:Uncharacterized protein n=1 Tax=Pandoravirus salinus TaxID=1349410 RepID=A0A291ATZ9_9VIRU|nr:hypothetical protein psal_cds_935 [Pandoravirus salinus]ATE82258.1 hypothetical protein psal_cds_935 [Pandoravirus salinus]